MWLHTTGVPVGHAMKGALCSRVTIEVGLLEKGRLTREITRARSISFTNDSSFKTANIQFQFSALQAIAHAIFLPVHTNVDRLPSFKTLPGIYQSYYCFQHYQCLLFSMCNDAINLWSESRGQRGQKMKKKHVSWILSIVLSRFLRLIVVCWNNPEKYLISQCRSIGFQSLLPGCIESVRRCFCETRPLKTPGYFGNSDTVSAALCWHCWGYLPWMANLMQHGSVHTSPLVWQERDVSNYAPSYTGELNTTRLLYPKERYSNRSNWGYQLVA